MSVTYYLHVGLSFEPTFTLFLISLHGETEMHTSDSNLVGESAGLQALSFGSRSLVEMMGTYALMVNMRSRPQVFLFCPLFCPINAESMWQAMVSLQDNLIILAEDKS